MATSRPGSIRCIATLLLGLAWPCLRTAAQFGPLLDLESAPQARSQEEFDQYLQVLAASDNRRTVDEAKKFLVAYPESALRGLAAVHQMEAYKAIGDFGGVLSSGERVLELLPDNLRALLTLAAAIPNTVHNPIEESVLLDQAESYATRALAVMESKTIPRSIRLKDWRRFRAGMASEAREALGHVAAKRGRIKRAVTEFELAVELNPDPEGRQFFRLGAAYAAVGRDSEAADALQRAVALGPRLVRQRAIQELKSLGASAPGSGLPPDRGPATK